jgi:2-phospho-L-lactate/phosphoenolpyruvate guanylyltransferase
MEQRDMRPCTWAIVPVKSLARAKRRLSPLLSAPVRRRLVLTMLEDVLDVLAASSGVDRVLVVSADADVAALAALRGAALLGEDRPAGLNAAVRNGLAHARAQGAAQALVLPADVPMATTEELVEIVAWAPPPPTGRVRLVASADGEGTNALLLAPPGAIEPAFGRGSFARHLARALARRCAAEVLQLPGLAGDIDRPRDLARLFARRDPASRYGFLGAPAPAPQAVPERGSNR